MFCVVRLSLEIITCINRTLPVYETSRNFLLLRSRDDKNSFQLNDEELLPGSFLGVTLTGQEKPEVWILSLGHLLLYLGLQKLFCWQDYHLHDFWIERYPNDRMKYTYCFSKRAKQQLTIQQPKL